VNAREDAAMTALRRLQPVRDAELEDQARSERGQAMLASILAEGETELAPRSRLRRWIGRRRGIALIGIVGTLTLAAGAAALLVRNDGLPTRDELRAGASNGELAPGQTYVDVPLDLAAGPTELRRALAERDFDIKVRLVPASPLLVGRILSASGSGGGEQIRELRRDCPTPAPCSKFGLKVPDDFSGPAVIVLGMPADGHEPHVHVRSFQAKPPNCIALVGRRAGEAGKLIESRMWSGANPLWYDVDNRQTFRETSKIADLWVVDAVKAGGYLDDPGESQVPRVVLAVSRKRAPIPPPIRGERMRLYQGITQQGC
jgi:hypothetical protein